MIADCLLFHHLSERLRKYTSVSIITLCVCYLPDIRATPFETTIPLFGPTCSLLSFLGSLGTRIEAGGEWVHSNIVPSTLAVLCQTAPREVITTMLLKRSPQGVTLSVCLSVRRSDLMPEISHNTETSG
jgi:hypothetical protein